MFLKRVKVLVASTYCPLLNWRPSLSGTDELSLSGMCPSDRAADVGATGTRACRVTSQQAQGRGVAFFLYSFNKVLVENLLCRKCREAM